MLRVIYYVSASSLNYMARVFALDEEHCDLTLRSALQTGLRVYDECVALPQAHRSVESGAFKNVVFNLNGAEAELDPDMFSSNWFSGVSGVQISTEQAESILNNPSKRAAALKALAAAIPSEMAEGNDVVIGPELECTADDRDLKGWTCGFDSPSCCVGIYAASQQKTPDLAQTGISRSHKIYFLMCKAGGGLAAQTFHSRLSASLKRGMSLDEALAEGNSPGAQALRRVGMAAQRNRGRILCLAAAALGLRGIDTLNDTACPEDQAYRVAVCNLNIVTNSIQKLSSSGGGCAQYQYFAGCVDTALSQGIITLSNAAEGFVLFSDQDGSFRINCKNSACNAIPFSSLRLKTNKELVVKAADVLKQQRDRNKEFNPIDSVHVDAKWIRERFAWNGRQFGIDLEPPPLLGSHASETFTSVWCRELGLSSCRAVRLEPELVCISAVEPAKLRAAARHVLGAEMKR